MNVLLDADGVFVDFVQGYLDCIFMATGKRFTHDQIGEFDIGKALGLTEDEVNATLSYITPGFCSKLSPLPGALETIQRIMTIADVYVVTSPLSALPTWASEREGWIQQHLGLSKKRAISTSAKHMVKGDFLIDDRAENCANWIAENNGTAVIWESPWNVRYPWNGLRFNNWPKLEKLITEESKSR